MYGKIIKGIAGFYYVNVENCGVIECKAKGIFRKEKIKPLVGDNVEIDIIDEKNQIGNIIDIQDRSSELIRPAVSNVDQAIVIFAVADPAPNLNLLDRFLIMMRKQSIDTIICFNKIDRVSEKEKQTLEKIYEKSGCKVLFTCVKAEIGIDEVKSMLMDKTTVLAGPSGVGKSSLINCLGAKVQMETGTISEKIKRGKHTTRHSELIFIKSNTYIMDTPGFSSLLINDMEKEELKENYPEFYPYEHQCRFIGCVHLNEPDCAVKHAIAEGRISKERYANYKQIFDELKNQKRY